MDLGTYAARMAQYNQWMNRKTYEAAGKLSDEQRKRDLNAFFKSLHDTLDHVLWADRAFLKRLASLDLRVGKRGVRLFEDFADMRAERERMDQACIEWAASFDASVADTQVPFLGDNLIAMSDVVVHMFNHQIHHRGQATTLLVQLGQDPGTTDLPYMLLEQASS